MTWHGRKIVGGDAKGPALVSMSALSFLGDIDIRSGKVVEPGSDIFGRCVAGRILIIPNSRGSAGAWRFLYQLHQHGTHPLALITGATPDPSMVQGAIMCAIPIVSGVALALCAGGVSDDELLAVHSATVQWVPA